MLLKRFASPAMDGQTRILVFSSGYVMWLGGHGHEIAVVDGSYRVRSIPRSDHHVGPFGSSRLEMVDGREVVTIRRMATPIFQEEIISYRIDNGEAFEVGRILTPNVPNWGPKLQLGEHAL